MSIAGHVPSFTFVEACVPTHGIVTNNGPEENNCLIPIRRLKTVLESVVGFFSTNDFWNAHGIRQPVVLFKTTATCGFEFLDPCG